MDFSNLREQRLASALLAVGEPANPLARILLLSYETTPAVFTNQPSGLFFMGGFDHHDPAFDHSRDTSFLLLVSPAGTDTDEVKAKFGTVEVIPKSRPRMAEAFRKARKPKPGKD